MKSKKADRIVRVVAGLMADGTSKLIPIPKAIGVNNPKNYVSSTDPADVRWTSWTRRMLRNGDLVLVADSKVDSKAKSAKGTSTKAEG